MTLEPAVYPDTGGRMVIELSYEIPYTSLAFLRDGESYVGRYRFAAQAYDKRRNALAGDAWDYSVSVADYDRTVARDSSATGSARLIVSTAAVEARVVVTDLSSDRRAAGSFKLVNPGSGMLLRLFRSGRPFAARRYAIADTLEAYAELLSATRAAADSCRFRVSRLGRTVAGATLPLSESAGRRGAWFRLPVSDSTGTAMPGGDYSIEAEAVGGAAVASLPFRIEVPFFLNDDEWADHVNKLLIIASTDEMKRLRAVARPERESAWRAFWKPKDPLPTTERNEREEDYFERIAYADEHFGHGDLGFRSDRGRVYVLFGPPDQVDSRPFEIDSPAYETWYYYETNRRFLFVDRTGVGVFRLENPEALIDQ